MEDHLVAAQVHKMMAAQRPFFNVLEESNLFRLATEPGACDFLAGNPQEVASPEYVETLKRWAEPKDKFWFAYKMMDPKAQEAAAAGLTEEVGITFEPEDIILTRGAHGALGDSLRVLVDPGDEVIFISPPWFFYESLIAGAGATPVRVKVDRDSLDVDVQAIRAAITDRTRVVLVNTPNNPTGRIYSPETLRSLAVVLSEASEANQRPIYIVSDEAYSRILFDGNPFFTPAAYYPRTLMIHTYSKSALAPGQRLGFVALPPDMPGREQLRMAFMAVMMGTGGGLPDAIMQYALPDIEKISIDLDLLQKKRDWMGGALKKYGYQLELPEATFYLLCKSPLPDDAEFADRLAQNKVLVLPGKACEMPGFFRISLTATEDMIERALPVFASAAP